MRLTTIILIIAVASFLMWIDSGVKYVRDGDNCFAKYGNAMTVISCDRVK